MAETPFHSQHPIFGLEELPVGVWNIISIKKASSTQKNETIFKLLVLSLIKLVSFLPFFRDLGVYIQFSI